MDESVKNIKQIIYEKALFLIQYAPQTEKTLLVKLLKKGFPQEEIVSVINRLKEKQLINDSDYAKLYAEELIRVKSLGYKKIMEKMARKGIERSDADQITRQMIEEFGGEMEIVKNYIFKNHRFFKTNYENKDFARIKNKLYTHGFIKINQEELIVILEEL